MAATISICIVENCLVDYSDSFSFISFESQLDSFFFPFFFLRFLSAHFHFVILLGSLEIYLPSLKDSIKDCFRIFEILRAGMIMTDVPTNKDTILKIHQRVPKNLGASRSTLEAFLMEL